MTDDQINAAIAEACGWTKISSDGIVGEAPGETCNRVMFVPLYCVNLNAMHEAEKTLRTTDSHEYANMLYDIACKNQEQNGKWLPYSISARQRAEAFLKTLGLWKEATDKESLTVGGATTEECSVDQKEVQA